ncbi:arginase family protein [Kribbella sp. NPDC026611]|uniref:arginase family protein n=1 Tax=Kribbella sp. NPDC026611 TaxID=3154911 RepID=UPI0033E44E7F
MTTVLCVPQWQGSAAKSARQLVVGATRSAEALQLGTVVTVPVVEGALEITDGIRAYGALVENVRLTGELLAGIDDFVITVGGDCGVEVAPIEAARQRYGDELRVLWIDAHADCYGPNDLRSGAFHGMVVRTLLGDGPALLTPHHPLNPEQLVHAGLRVAADVEREFIRTTGVRGYGVDDLERAADGLDGPTYVHIDLDVLDPAEFGSVGYPEPGGVPAQRLIEFVAGLGNVVGAGITEHAPSTDNANETAIIHNLGRALS